MQYVKAYIHKYQTMLCKLQKSYPSHVSAIKNDIYALNPSSAGPICTWKFASVTTVSVGFVASDRIMPSGPRLNIKTVFPRYGDSHVQAKTVGETVLSLTWESLNW